MKLETAMILAAGRGERMRPLTDVSPKPMLEIHGKPLLQYHIENLVASGIKRIVINHAWLGEQIKTFIDSRTWPVEVLESAEQEALETAGGIIKALPLLCAENTAEQFIVVNGDIYTDFAFSTLPVLSDKLAHLVMVTNPQHNPRGDFVFENDTLYNFEKSHETPVNAYTFSGIGVYHKDFFASSQRGKQGLGPMLKTGVTKQQISAQVHTSMWNDVGTPERLAKLNDKETSHHANLG